MTEINSLPEIKRLPEGTVLLDRDNDVWQLRGGLWCSYETSAHPAARMVRYGPFTVLHDPRKAVEQRPLTQARLDSALAQTAPPQAWKTTANSRRPATWVMEFLAALGVQVES